MLDKPTALHLSNRLGFGPAPGDLGRIEKMGLDEFLDAQLHPQPGVLPPPVISALQSLPSFGKSSAQAYQEYWWTAQVADPKTLPMEEKKRLKARQRRVAQEARIARLARAIGSPWQLHEALVEFWFNHFNVYAQKGPVNVWIGAYEEEAIRPYTLSHFRDLLFATAKHPAMLVYLDNAQNMAPSREDPAQAGMFAKGPQNVAQAGAPRKKKNNGINENYAREVMELHTLGVDGGYTQADVIALAHILTGWTVGPGADADTMGAAEQFRQNKGAFRFAARRHDPSPEMLLGRNYSGADVSEGEAALLMLAAHPSTARHISFQLAQYFVADQPPADLVDAMAKTFRQSDGDIRSVVKTMLARPEFLAPANYGTKYKTPYRYVVSAARAAGLAPAGVRPLVGILRDLGQPLYECISPDGYACTQSAWLDPDGLLNRLTFAMDLGNGEYSALGDVDAGPTALDPDQLIETLRPAFSKTTLAALSETPKDRRAGAILGSPDFMRC